MSTVEVRVPDLGDFSGVGSFGSFGASFASSFGPPAPASTGFVFRGGASLAFFGSSFALFTGRGGVDVMP